MTKHNVPGFGELGQNPEEFERARIAGLGVHDIDAPGTARPPVIERDRSVTVAEQQRRFELTEALKPLIGEAFGDLSRFLSDLQHDIRAQSELMTTMNVPMESIVDSHERASQSFERLRKEMADAAGGVNTAAVEQLARVVDTAGLGKAQSRAEQRFERLAQSIEARLKSIEEVQAKTFSGLAADMLKIVHLLKRLQARELRDAKARSQADGKK